ncbi:putative 1-phosphatidylinositol-3-phosphate 5-kinase FAB1D [Nicotiana tomentosiformis]|uniref:putative 1-phosphatidylinositol-3-phosphate 5-kinase FAB1D n=1 Tax=Nicotiana tomentosiformis TaxID=4098 RepID=UPI00051BFACD|nr:putative 1-phosphatidylinositol-3-phosphate 5-kinase FAB1D [Nicotiana tomentosiformis]
MSSCKMETDGNGTSSSCDLDACFWLPPEPEHCYDDMEFHAANYEDDDGSHNFKEEKQKLLGDMMDQRLKPLVDDLLNSSGVVSSGKEGDNWIDIVISLSLEAASFFMPTAAEGNAMDPNRYLKIKCIATGSRSKSQFIRGLVFNKHAAHKHMPTQYNKPRLLLIQGALGLSSNELSVFESFRQENDRVKSIIDMIESYEPNVVLVEKSVSRDLQEYALNKGLTLIVDIKQHRMERVALCTGSSIISSETLVDLRQCDSFHFEKFLEEHDSSGDSVKRSSKTLMFIRGCSTHRGSTILLMGTNSNELKKVKYVICRAVTMAYNLILETSFLLDQKAMIIRHNLEEEGEHLLFKPKNPEDHGQNDVQVSDKEKTPEKEQLHCPLQSAEESLENPEDKEHNNDVMTSSFDWESTLVMMSSWNAKRGTNCVTNHFSRIRFYQDYDIPLGKFLRDNLLNQRNQCGTCGVSPKVHIFRYAHHEKLLTIKVHSLPLNKALSGETEGKIWMWSCCNGGSKNTKRVLMSIGSLGFSFGRFLQLGFCDSSLFSRLPDRSQSFNSDFLYFFGLGSMVAVFKYPTFIIYSVSLPPPILEFSSSTKGEFCSKDFEDVYTKGIMKFLDVEKALKAIESRFNGTTINIQGSNLEFSEVEKMLKEERSQFEIDIKNTEKQEAVYKALSLNRIQLELLLELSVWDRRLHSLMSSDYYPKTIYQNQDALAAILDANATGASYFNPQRSRSLLAILSNIEHNKGWWTPFPEIRREYMKNLQRGYLTRLGSVATYGAETIACGLTSTDEVGKLYIPLGSDKYIVSDYEDEFSSIIACALALLMDLPVVSHDLEDESCSSSLPRTHKYSVICPYARPFLHLRDRCCPSEVDFIASLSRCRSWYPKGRKTNSFFAKTLDDRFIVKEIKRNEFESFLKFAPCYFDYMDQCIEQGSQTCLAKILGIYQVIIRSSGKEKTHDLVVMENLSFGKDITRRYELKGTLHARLSSANDGAGGIFQDQNFVNDMNIYPIYVDKSSNRNLQRAVWNDTVFLSTINVMDYSLFVGMNTEGNELVCGIVDYLRQYTWDVQLFNWFNSSLPSPQEYKKRFRKFINKHFPL